MLDMKSSSADVWTNPQVAAQQSRLNVLIQAMKELHPKYDGVDSISKTIRYFMECTYLEGRCTDSDRDILARHPTYYLRLVMTLDLSFSQDRLPEESDFPTKLRGLLGVSRIMPMLEYNSFTQLTERSPDSEDNYDVAPIPDNISEWIETDRSVQFARELGLAPTSLSIQEEESERESPSSDSVGSEVRWGENDASMMMMVQGMGFEMEGLGVW